MNNILNVQGDLATTFGNYSDQTWDDEWQNLQEKYPVSSYVTGTVELIYQFGCFLNIGTMFPAFLLIANISPAINLVPKEYQKAIKIGLRLTGRIYGYDDERRQIFITQMPYGQSCG